MRNLHCLNGYRDVSQDVIRHFGGVGDETCGLFRIPSSIDGQIMTVIASSDCGWDHVSVSRKSRCPNWPEMDKVKRLFFRDDEVVMQLHVASKDHVSDHDYCLHLWRPSGQEIPLPPKFMVGGMSKEEAEMAYDEAMKTP